MKFILRQLSLAFERMTRKWVIPSSVWSQLEEGDSSAAIGLSDAAVKWGTCDPEILRANLIARRNEYIKSHSRNSPQKG